MKSLGDIDALARWFNKRKLIADAVARAAGNGIPQGPAIQASAASDARPRLADVNNSQSQPQQSSAASHNRQQQ